MFTAVTGGRGGTRELVHEQIRRVARSIPARLAVSDHDGTLTYGELDARANALAHDLRALGVGPGVRVGVCHRRAAVNIVGVLAVLKAGGAYIGMDPTFPEARIDRILRDAGAPVLLTERSVIERLGSTTAEVVDLEIAAVAESPHAVDTAGVGVGLDDPAYVMYTSGSSGQPKGVEVSHGNLLQLVDWHNREFTVVADDRASVLANPAFDASVWESWPYLTLGASLHIPEPNVAVTPERLRDWLVATDISLSFAPTPLAEALLELDWPETVPLRCMLTGGDVLHRRPQPDIPFPLVNNYGVAEATVVSTSAVVAPRSAADGLPSIGRAIAGAHLYVLGDDGRPVGAGETGELHIGGTGVALGYVNRPDLTAERFLSDPFDADPHARMYRTGDLVRMTAEHEYQFVGRLDSQVQVRGQRVELDEIAAAVTSHPQVARSVVIGCDGDAGNLRLLAYFVPAKGQVPSNDDLRSHVSALLPGFMVPNAFVMLNVFPLTANGKIDRDALPAFQPVTHPGDAGRTPVERVVLAILAELLELRGIGLHDNFFELGGHSLMVAQLLAEVEDHFDVELPMLTVFDNPSAAGIATAIEHEIASYPSVAG